MKDQAFSKIDSGLVVIVVAEMSQYTVANISWSNRTIAVLTGMTPQISNYIYWRILTINSTIT